jgi:hypothetical protein
MVEFSLTWRGSVEEAPGHRLGRESLPRSPVPASPFASRRDDAVTRSSSPDRKRLERGNEAHLDATALQPLSRDAQREI